MTISRLLLLAFWASLLAAVPARANPPAGWILAGSDPDGYEVGVDRRALHGGKPSAFIRGGKKADPNGFGTLLQTIMPDRYKGKRVRLSAFVRSQSVAGWAGLWMRVDCPDQSGCAFDNMQNRAIKGTTAWKRHEVVLDVAPQAEAIAFGVLLSGPGETWVNQVRLEVVDKSVPTTAITGLNKEPTNLDFSK